METAQNNMVGGALFRLVCFIWFCSPVLLSIDSRNAQNSSQTISSSLVSVPWGEIYSCEESAGLLS